MSFFVVGNSILSFFEMIGVQALYFISIVKSIFRFRFKGRLVSEQLLFLGVNSIPIVIITSVFVGMAFTVQIVREFLRFGAGEMVGGIVGMAFWRELGPLMTGVVIAGRIGAAISAELGTMKVTEQVEALEALSQDPIEYLVVPRCLALVIIMPLLVGLADILGFFAGFIVSMLSNINPSAYFHSAQTMLDVNDVVGGLIKAAFFGFSIGFISSYKGLTAESGARGVGKVTRRSVVHCLIAVLILNYFFSIILY